MKKLQNAAPENDYHFDLVENISRKTHLSKIALFTRLLFNNKISLSNYNNVKSDLEEKYLATLKAKRKAKRTR